MALDAAAATDTTTPRRPASHLVPTAGRSSFFERWGAVMYRRRKAVLVLALAFTVFAGVWGTTVFASLTGGGFEDPGSESTRAAQVIDEQFGSVGADVVVLYSAPDGSALTVASPAFRRSVEQALAQVPTKDVVSVADYWTTRSDAFVAADRRTTYVALRLAGSDESAREETYTAISDALVADGLTTLRGGAVATSAAINTQVTEDIARAESLSIPILLILLVLVFGSLASASLPLAIGGIAILGSFTVLNVITKITDVSIFAVNIVTMLGLGLAIDYALFMVARFREELAAGNGVEESVVRTMATAGRTVAFSGLTVALSLGALLLFPMNFLRSMGYGGIAAVLVAMIAAITVLPALLGVLGPKVDALRLPFLRRRPLTQSDPDAGAWARLARGVMRRPVMVVVATVALLMLLGAPFFSAVLGGVDARALPSGTEARVASEQLTTQFPATATSPVEVVVQGADAAQVEDFAARLAGVSGVTGVQVGASRTSAAGSTSVINLAYAGASATSSAQQIVRDVRALPAPGGAAVLVGGSTASFVDLIKGLEQRLPWAGLYLLIVTFTLLFMAFGSVVLPLKAIAMNLLSLSATFGVLVWGFQDGNLAGLLGFTSTGTIEATQPILIFALAFGLSMDYEVFLLSRIREEWDRTGDNTLAVTRGLQRSGRIITSAALLFVVVVGAFATSGIVFIQMIGVGLALAVLIDATIVRALLVPATMKILGRWNWYAPAPMVRFWDRYGVREGDAVAARDVEVTGDAVLTSAAP